MRDTPSTSPAATGIAPDAVLAGRYRVRRRLARGGMAEVWEADDEVLARPVAVKLLLPHLAADDAFVARFRREAVAAARLSHPHIAAIYDTFRQDGVEAIVMELVPGRTLRRLLDHGESLPVERAVAIALDVADALEHAHRAGLVHRDVKPANILLADSGRVVVTDFGIAKAAVDAGGGDADLTEAGTVLGTAKYLSPEQVEGRPVDARSDVYALGCVLYEMLCGRPPFQAATPVATAAARLRERPLLPRQVRPDVPRSLEGVVLRCLAVDPADRPRSAGDLSAALRSLDLAPGSAGGDLTELVVHDPTPPAGTAASPRFTQTERSWLVPAVLIVVVAVALGVAGLLLGRTEVGRQLFEGAREAVTGSRPAPPPAVAAVGSFDPHGGGGEHDELLGNLVDGDAATAWTTEGYESRYFGNLKPGVGVVLRLEQPGRVGRLVVTSPTTGWAAQVFVADAPAPTVAGWGRPAAGGERITGDHTFDLGGRTGGAVLLWITDLGNGPPLVRVELAELALQR